ncbi:MAG: response regulator, partial [Myxococcota bacterium]
AGRADEALELMGLTAVDLVVTDFRMPGQDGISFISEISRRYPSTRCILMTAHGDNDTKNRSLAQGAVSFIEKPFDLDFFISEVNRHLSVSGFTGRSLVGFSLLDILQLVSMSQQSVTITVHSNNGVGSLFVQDGVLIHSEAGAGLNGLNAAYEIVSWSDGDIASSRGVAEGTERSINMPLMTFLMEAAKHQDEKERNQPLNNVKDVIKEWCGLDGMLAAAVLDTKQGREVYGESAEKGVSRMQLGKAIMASYQAMNDSLSESGLSATELSVSLSSAEAVAMSMLDGRFLALLAARDKATMGPARAALTEKLNGLIIALSDYEKQASTVESGDFESISFDDVEDALDLSGIGES